MPGLAHLLYLPLVSLLYCVVSVTAKVTISDAAAQTMHGIGASGAWWPLDVYSFPEETKERIATLLFEQSLTNDGLSLKSYRYNVGGGGVYVANPSRAPETVFVSPGVYNWSADPQGVYFLKKAAAAHVPMLTAFVNSAPTAFTSNNKNCGGFLLDSQVGAYAQFLADVISHWKGEGVKFTHVSPMNEPDNGFMNIDGSPCGQEGMIVLPTQRAAVVHALRSALDGADLNDVGILADESSWYSEFTAEAWMWLSSAKDALVGVAHHDYGFEPDALAAVAAAEGHGLSGKDMWFTEICCFVAADASRADDPTSPLKMGSEYDPTIMSALRMMNLVYQSFTVVGDAHFDWWTALSGSLGCDPSSNSACATSVNTQGSNDALLYYDPAATTHNNFAIYTTKRFFALKHLANSIPADAVRHDANGLPDNVKALAFDWGNVTSIVAMNFGTSNTTLDLSGIRTGQLSEAWQTTAEVDWVQLARGNPTVQLPGRSVSSFWMQ